MVEGIRGAELELMLQRERVAELRRSLPPGPEMPDYRFHQGPTDLHVDGPLTTVGLHELVGDRPLVLYHFMYGGAQVEPCPMCAMWADGWDGVAPHLERTIDFAVVAAAPIDEWRAFARGRGWQRLRLLSAFGSSFKIHVGGEDAEGHQLPFVSVYHRTGGKVRLSYSGGAHIHGEHWRGVDLLSPVWHLLDLTRPGRGDWTPSLGY
ncbi:MAG: DUF899 family protein [Acidimicrobiales bacterium]